MFLMEGEEEVKLERKLWEVRKGAEDRERGGEEKEEKEVEDTRRRRNKRRE